MTDQQPNRISESRKTAYYLGTGMSIVGVILFASPFLAGACFLFSMAGSSGHGPEDFPTSIPVAFGLAIIGFFLIAGGSAVSRLGRSGLAGSGLMLDPDKAREDLKPWNKMAGGMINDTLSEVEPVQKIVEHLTEEHAAPTPAQVIKVRCRGCNALNDEDARFCDQCGGQL